MDQAAPVRHRFGFLLATAHRRLQLAAGKADEGSAARNGLLMAIGDGDAGTRMAEVGRRLDVGASALTGLTDRAVAGGLVVRMPDPEDGRAWILTLTRRGVERRRAAIAQAHGLNARMTQGFTPAELDVVARWLEAIRTRFPKEDER